MNRGIIPRQNANSGPNQNANFDYQAPVPLMLLQVWSTIALDVFRPNRNCLTQPEVVALTTTPQILARYAKDKAALTRYMAMNPTDRNQVVQLTFAQKVYCLG